MIGKSYSSEIKDYDGTGRIVVAANCFGNVDSQNDVSMQGSFKKTLSENFARVKWFLNHRTDQLLGVPLEGKETDQYLVLTGQINLKKTIGLDTFEDYKLYAEHGKTLEHSIGVDPIKYETDTETGIRRVKEWKLWEYSTLTAWGSNERTPMLDMKAAAQVEWLGLMLKKGNYTDEKCLQIEQTLTILKSLCAEPDISTQGTEPIAISEFADITKTIITSLQTN